MGEAETSDDRYILTRTEEEYTRLRLQARAWEEVTRRVLTGAGLKAGMRCLDAGCGPGEAMRLMGRLVGSGGRVVGIDTDARLGTYALAELHRREGPQFDFVAGDVTGGAPVPGGPFDLVFARFLICHMTEPVAAVQRLAAQVRPGGRLVLMDYDMTRMALRPADPVLERAFEVIRGCFDASGRSSDAGLRLGEFVLAAGLPMPDGAEVGGIYAPIRGAGIMMRAVLGGLKQSAAALGVASAEEVGEIQAYVQKLEAENRNFALVPLVIGVWTTVPGPLSPAS